jgi:hypothetical protein
LWLKVISLAALVGAIAIAVLVFWIPSVNRPIVPEVRFTEFTPDVKDIRVGESAKIVFNVQSSEDRPINDSAVTITVEPSGSQQYLIISEPVVKLPPMLAKDSRTGEHTVTVHAASLPAKEAVFDVEGVLVVEGKKTDSQQFELRVRE